MEDKLKKEIASLVDAPELREFLMESDEVNALHCADIIAKAPIGLQEKWNLLFQLRMSATEEERNYAAALLERLSSAIASLKCAGSNGDAFLLVAPWCYSEEGAFDGPFPVRSFAEAQKLVADYRAEYQDEDWESRFWKIDLYDRSAKADEIAPWSSKYSFLCSPKGEPWFFRQSGKAKDEIASAAFASPDLDIPVPYRPGDILRIDCRPFVPSVHYCLLVQVESGCCGVWCVFRDLDVTIGRGSLKHAHCFAREYNFLLPLSPLYHAQVYTGELPPNCRFMEDLSKKIHADPSYGDRIDEVISDLRLC